MIDYIAIIASVILIHSLSQKIAYFCLCLFTIVMRVNFLSSYNSNYNSYHYHYDYHYNNYYYYNDHHNNNLDY